MCYHSQAAQSSLRQLRLSGNHGLRISREHVYYLYILASRRNGTLYVGVTNDLIRRVCEHRDGLIPGFTKKYGVKLLVYYEVHHDINEAILREKRIKRWAREWKLYLIEKQNPQWRDLWFDLTGTEPATQPTDIDH